MYEYKFVKLDLAFFSGRPEQDYHELVDRHAALAAACFFAGNGCQFPQNAQ